MADLNKLHKQYRDANLALNSQPNKEESDRLRNLDLPKNEDGTTNRLGAQEQMLQEARQLNKVDSPSTPGVNIDELTQMGSPEEAKANMINRDILQAGGMAVGQNIRDADDTWSHTTWNPRKVHQDYVAQIGENIAFGTGQMIGQYGDLFHALDVMITGDNNGNALSRLLQDYGQEVMDNNTSYIPPELMDPEFKLSTFLNPQFWTIHGARFVPQLVEIMATGVAAGGVRNLAQKGVSAALRSSVKEGSEAMFKKGFVGSTSGKLGGKVGTEGFVRNKAAKGGWWKKHITDEGLMTNGLSNAIQNVSAGTLTNLRVGLSNAGELHTQLRDQTDKEGNRIYTDEEIGQATSDAFMNNLSYLGMDVASWAFTFGKGSLNLGKSARKAFSSAEQTKYIGGLAGVANGRILSGVAKLATKGTVEGLEETVQESWEEYSKLRAVLKMGGDLKTYEGGRYADLMDGKDVSKGKLAALINGDALDFYLSKENEATRTISFGLGAMAGGAMNVRTAFNKNANMYHDIRTRAEAFKAAAELGSSRGEAIKTHQINQMIEIVDDDKMHLFAPWMKQQIESGNISNEDFKIYEKAFEEIAAEKARIGNLSIRGKSALLQSRIMSNHVSGLILDKQNEFNEAAVLHAEQFGHGTDNFNEAEFNKSYEKLQNSYIDELNAMYAVKEQHDSNARAIISGRSSKRNAFRTRFDPELNRFVFEKSGETEFTDEFNPMYASKTEEKMSSFSESVKNNVSSFVDSVKDRFIKRRTARNSRKGAADIEISNPETFASYSDEDLDTLHNLFEESNLTDEELQAIADKHGVEVSPKSTSDGFDGDNVTAVANAAAERNRIENDRRNAIEKKFIREKLNEQAKDDEQRSQELESIDNEINSLEENSEGVKKDMTSNTSKKFMEENEDSSISDLADHLNSEMERLNEEAEKLEAGGLNDQKSIDALENVLNQMDDIEADQRELLEKTSEPLNKIKELQKKKKELEKDRKPNAEAKHKRRLEERLGLLDGVSLEDQRKARREELLEQKKKEQEEKAKENNDPKKKLNARAKLGRQLKSILREGKELTSELKDSIINTLEEEGYIDATNKGRFTSIIDNFFRTQEQKANKKKRDDSSKDRSSRDRIVPEKTKNKPGARQRKVKKVVRKIRGKGNKRFKINLNHEQIKALKEKAKAGSAEAAIMLRNLKREANSITRNATNSLERQMAQPLYSLDGRSTAQALSVNERMSIMFPGQVVSVHNVKNIHSTLGYDTLGMAIGSTIFIDSSQWNQPKTYMHEVGHIFFNLTQHTEETKALIDSFLNNKRLLKIIKDKYWDQEILIDAKTNEEFLISDLDKFDPNNKAEFLALLEQDIQDGFFVRVPDNEQSIWLDELFAYHLEGPLSQEYNMYFERNNENERQGNLRSWWSFIKKRGKIGNLVGSKKTIEQKHRENIDPDDLEGYVNVFETTLDKFGDSIQNNPQAVRARVRFRREMDEAIRQGEEMAEIASILEKQKNFVRSNQYSRSKYNTDRDTFLNKDSISFFNKNGYPNEAGVDAIVEKLYRNANISGKIDTIHLNDIEFEMYMTMEDEIDNIIADRFDNDDTTELSDIDISNNQEVEFDDEAEMYDDPDANDDSSNELQLHENREKYANKYQKFIRGFVNSYNIALKEISTLMDPDTDYSDLKLADVDTLLDYFWNESQMSGDPMEFIYQLRANDNEIVSAMLDYLHEARPSDDYKFLQSMYVVMSNLQETVPIQKRVKEDGTVDVSNSLSRREINRVQNTFEKILRTFHRRVDPKTGRAKESSVKPYTTDNKYMRGLDQAMESIRSGDFHDQDIRMVLNFFSSPSVDLDKLIDRGYLVINGKSMNINDAVYMFLTSEKAFKDNVTYDMDGNRRVPRDINSFLRAIEATDRMNSARQTVLDANNNQVQSSIVKNGLLKFAKRIEKDALQMNSLSQFLKKYNFKNKASSIARSNVVLKQIWDQVKKGGRFDLSPNTGNSNPVTNNNKTVKQMSNVEKSFDSFITFMSKPRNQNTYSMDIGRLSDSSTAYNMEVPFLDVRKWENFDGESFNDSSRPDQLANAYQAYKSFLIRNNDSKRSYNYSDFIKGLNKAVDTEIEFLRDIHQNSINQETGLSNYKSLNQVFDKNGNLTRNGRMVVSQYVANDVVNSISIQQILFPSLGLNKNEIIKRSKLMASPSFSMHENVGIESIYFPDILSDTLTVNGEPLEIGDAASFILEEDAQRLRDYFGSQMKLGYGLKILNAGVELENDYFNQENTYDKGFTVELNEDFVQQNPVLRPLYELMKARREMYIERNGGNLPDLNTGQETQIIHAVPGTARKVKEGLSKVNATYLNAQGVEVTEELSLDDLMFNDLIDPETSLPLPNMKGLYEAEIRKANAIMDAMYYQASTDIDGNPQLDFNGQSGENFGIQQVMDIPKSESIISTQFLNFLSTNVMNNVANKQVNEILQGIADLQQENIRDIVNIVNRNDSEQLREFLLNNIDKNSVDQDQLAAIQTDKLSLETPWVRSLALNTISNIIRKRGNKIKTTGTVARQIPNFYYNKQTGEKSLKHTQVNGNGDVQVGEVVMPKHSKGKVQARRYFTFGGNSSDSQANKIIESVETEAKMRGFNEDQKIELLRKRLEKINKGTDKGIGITIKKGKVTGLYIEGDKVVATRIPAHGPQSTTVLEVIDFGAGNGYNAQLPAEFSMINTGGDFDGDQVFFQYKDNTKHDSTEHDKISYQNKWNETFDNIANYLASPNVVEESDQAIEFEEVAEAASDAVDNVYGKQEDDDVLLFSPEGIRNTHINTAESKSLIGIAASMHGVLSLFSNYNTAITPHVKINGVKANRFQDTVDKSRVLESARLFNLIMDNAATGFASKLKLNMQTISEAMILTNLGYSLSDIAVILNSDIAKKWAARKASRGDMFMNNDYREVQVTDSRGNVISPDENGDVKTKGNKVTSLQNQANILALLNSLSEITEDTRIANGILSGHNKMERNPFEAEKKIADFNRLMSGEGSLVINPSFRNNPRVQNYLKNAQTHLELVRKMDPTYRTVGEDVYKAVANNSVRNITADQKTKIKNDTSKAFDAIAFGINGYSDEHIDNVMNTIIKRIDDYKNEIMNDEVVLMPGDNSLRTLPGMKSLLFTKGILVNAFGSESRQHVSLNTQLSQDGFVESDRQRIIEEFSELPVDLIEDLLLYDFVRTGWQGPQSIAKIAPMEIKKKISDAAFKDSKSKSKENLSGYDQSQLHKAIIANNIDLIPKINKPLFNEVTSDIEGPSINQEAIPKHVYKAIVNHNPFTLKYQQKNGDVVVYEYKGIDGQKPKYKGNASSIEAQALRDVAPAIRSIGIKSSDLKEPNRLFLKTGNPKNENVIKSYTGSTGGRGKKKSNNSTVRKRTLDIDSDYLSFTSEMDFESFNKTANPDSIIPKSKMTKLYNKYKEDVNLAIKRAESWDNDYLKGLSNDELFDIYFESAKKDKLSQAPILKPIIEEITQREHHTQSELIRSNNPNAEYNPNESKDISLIQRYMMSNNIPSNHPAAQAMVRELETEYKKFLRERNRLMKELNTVTDALYREKRGYGVTSDNFIGQLGQRLRYLFDLVFNGNSKINETLYSDLITTDIFIDEHGNRRERIRYKTKSQINKLYNDGKISKTQLDFYNVSSKIMKDLAPYNADQEQQGYIPHTAPSLFEKFSRRGLMGVIADSKAPSEKIKDVVFKEFKDPITGEVMKNVTYENINKYFLEAGKILDRKNSLKYAAALYKYKVKAIELGNKGINEDGTPIAYSDLHIQTVLGDFKMNDFSKSRGVSAEMFPSLDLNKAFSEYINSSLITNGNENFKGLKQLYPLIDGVIHLANVNNNPNLKAYVEDVWKGYFIKGQRKDMLPNSKYVEALGTSPDKIVRYGLRASTFYWLGVKGLVGGAGLYAVGNVLAGKYFNIKNQGGKSWIKGEKRFWMGTKGIKLSDPFRGVKESVRILNRIGYMDINIYDDVAIYKKNDPNKILFEMALLPMIYSERWIQGVNFLGMLSDQEYESLANGGNIDPARLSEMENTVKKNHGKGYQPTDQRGIQMFSLGQTMMQFSRHIPTVFHDSFAKRDFDIYGKEDMGSTSALYYTLSQYISGYKSQSDFKKFFDGLSDIEKARTKSALAGLGMLSFAWAGSEFAGMKSAENVIRDVNAPLDFEKLSWKLNNPPLVSMLADKIK